MNKRALLAGLMASAALIASGFASPSSRSPNARLPIWSWFCRKLTNAVGGSSPLAAPRGLPPRWSDASCRSSWLFRFWALDLTIGLGRAEIKRVAIPGLRFDRVSDGAHAHSTEKGSIEGSSHPDRCLPVAGIGSTLVKEPR